MLHCYMHWVTREHAHCKCRDGGSAGASSWGGVSMELRRCKARSMGVAREGGGVPRSPTAPCRCSIRRPRHRRHTGPRRGGGRVPLRRGKVPLGSLSGQQERGNRGSGVARGAASSSTAPVTFASGNASAIAGRSPARALGYGAGTQDMPFCQFIFIFLKLLVKTALQNMSELKPPSR
jgi:hypothetical protein